MIEIKIKAYTYDDLTPKAQDVVFNNYLTNLDYSIVHDDIHNSIQYKLEDKYDVDYEGYDKNDNGSLIEVGFYYFPENLFIKSLSDKEKNLYSEYIEPHMDQLGFKELEEIEIRLPYYESDFLEKESPDILKQLDPIMCTIQDILNEKIALIIEDIKKIITDEFDYVQSIEAFNDWLEAYSYSDEVLYFCDGTEIYQDYIARQEV